MKLHKIDENSGNIHTVYN